jgi:hypothetical protein
MIFGWDLITTNTVVRLLSSGEEDFRRTVESEGGALGGAYSAIATDAFGNIFGAADGIVRLTAAGEDFPTGRFLPYEVHFPVRDGETFLAGYWGYARLDVAANDFVWKSKLFGEQISFPGSQIAGAPLDEEAFLVLTLTEETLDASQQLLLDRNELVADPSPYEFWLTTSNLWSREALQEFQDARLASSNGDYAFGLSFGSEARDILPL